VGNLTVERVREVTVLSSKVLAVTAALVSALTFLMHILTHYPFFDESIRVRFLWLLSTGLKPNVDYYTPHPSLGYLLTLPFMRLFPDSAFVVLALRCLSFMMFALIGVLLYRHGRSVRRDGAMGLIPFLLVVTAPAISSYAAEYSIDHLSAFVAFVVFVMLFTIPKLWKICVLPALCCISVLIMPKYIWPLMLGMAGYLITYYRNTKRLSVVLSAPVAGLMLTSLAVALLFLFNGMSFTHDINHSHLLYARLAASEQHTVVSAGSELTLSYVMEHLQANPILAAAVLLGIFGWTRYSWKEGGQILWAGGGILLGAMTSSILIRNYFEQHVTPVLLCFVLFVPFAFAGVRSAAASTGLRMLLILSALVTLSVHLGDAAMEFRETPYNGRGDTALHRRKLGLVAMVKPGLNVLSDYDRLLDIIPRDEQVAAVWPLHPLFRRDITFVTFDDVFFPLSLGLASNDPLKKQFEPESFRTALDNKPPAFIAPDGMEINYPPGWQQVALDFLGRNESQYIPYAGGFLRRDLLPISEIMPPGNFVR